MKTVLMILLKLINEEVAIDLVIELLEKIASKTKTKVDDKLISMLREYQGHITGKVKEEKEKLTQ